VYDHIRARLQSTLQARQADGAAAAASTAAAQAALDAATAAIAAAQAALAAATQVLAAAHNSLAAANASVQARTTAVASAQSDVDDWMAEEHDFPSDPGHPGHPNPGWAKRMAELQRILATARQALVAAQAAAANAGAAVGSAAAAVLARQNDLAVHQAELAAAQARLVAAQAAATAAAAGIADAQAALATLDERAARVLATPLDADDLAAFADEEQVDVSRLRQQRAVTRATRHTVSVQRDGILADHDAGIEALAALASAMHQWTDSTIPDPPQLAGSLDAIVTSARTQRGAMPRADDLAGLTTPVQAVLDRLQADVAQATARSNQAAAALQAAIAAVDTVNQEAP
jgi:hypothetical protein